MTIKSLIKIAPVADDTLIISDYDYSALGENAATVQSAALDIRNRLVAANRNIIQIGEKLLAVKVFLAHGEFGKWLKAEFEWSERTAQRYMLAASFAEQHSDTVSVLPEKVLYLVSAKSTPDAIKAKVIEHAAKGEISKASEIEAEIKAAKQASEPVVKPKADERKVAAEKAAMMLAEKLGSELKAFMAEFKIAGDRFPAALKKAVAYV